MYLVYYYTAEVAFVGYQHRADEIIEIWFDSFVESILFQRMKSTEGYVTEGYSVATPNCPCEYIYHNGYDY